MPTAFLFWLIASLTPQQVLETALEIHGWGKVKEDPRLTQSARELARLIAGSQAGLEPSAMGARLRFTLRQNGIGDEQLVPYTATSMQRPRLAEHLPELLSRLKKRTTPTHYGLAVEEEQGVFVLTVLLVHRGINFDEPLPKAVRGRTVIGVRGQLRRGYFGPKMFIHKPDGELIELTADNQARRFEFKPALGDQMGTYRVELVASSQYGPVVLFKKPIYVGITPPVRPTTRLHRPRGKQDEPRFAEELFELINRYRARAGRSSLTHLTSLNTLAAEHAAELKKLGQLSHFSAKTGSLKTRLLRVGLNASLVAENLAFAKTPSAALMAFHRSPGHAKNMLLPGLTHMGVAFHHGYFVVAFVGLNP